MSFTVLDCPQRSVEWFQARLGRLTGTCASDMLATIKTGEAAARRDLRMRLVTERLTGQSQEDGYVNAVMQRGIDLEPEAIGVYEALTGQVVVRTGFLEHAGCMAGCSLDGHVGDDVDGVVSIKCPKSATHLKYLRAGMIPSEYVPQMTHELWITGARYYDFLSYDPRFPEPLQVFYLRFHRLQSVVDTYEQKALAFLEEVEREMEAVRTMCDLPSQLKRAAEVSA